MAKSTTSKGKPNGPPPGEPWIWTSARLIESDAWRSRGINAVRFVDFLMREHMRHGGACNGKLKAPYGQLENWGIGARYVADAIREAEALGLVDVMRPGFRMASTYRLTWLAAHDGSPPSNRWQETVNPALRPPPTPRSRNLPRQGKAGLPAQGKAEGPILPPLEEADGPEIAPSLGKELSRRSYRDRGDTLGV
jgi:hypothetical protein